MTRIDPFFAALTLMTIIPAVFVVTTNNVVHAAIYLAATLLAVAGFFFALDAPFVASAQILIYVGAITVLILFAVMLTAQRRLRATGLTGAHRFLAGGACLALFWQIGVAPMMYGGWPGAVNPPEPVHPTQSLDRLAASLLGTYALPFEVASVFLLAALVGAIVLAKSEDAPDNAVAPRPGATG